MIVDNIGESCFKPRSGDINLSCLRNFNAFSSDLAIILSCLRHYLHNYFSILDSHYMVIFNGMYKFIECRIMVIEFDGH